MSRLIKTDRDVATVVGKLLRFGVLSACLVAIIGGLMFLILHRSEISDFTQFRGAPEYLRSLEGIYGGLLALDARAVIQAGVLILIATPILRVALSVFAFALEGDYLYVVITVIVLLIISVGMFGGLAG
ncbi:putative membrane protein [Arcticibacter pallidicorallinus]|uniref:Putative membrane protein n=1 Tax=Arcticibacter pallidicorallinus TaxID=1259464 RepID=A0A2T0TZ14_9SPHI|nr:DUF1634 domain-containing protein [Arcticibacter pallidicorallinus]PRY50912.1 putative membrane protein [Arcticibacter pallidicorallinus]